jgi:hypothetical protein
MAEQPFDPDAYLAEQPFDPDAYLGQPAKPRKYQFLRPKVTGMEHPPSMAESVLRGAAGGATFGLDAPIVGGVASAITGRPYKDVRREYDERSAAANKELGSAALPLALMAGGGAISKIPMLGKALAPISSGAGAPARGVWSLLGRALGGGAEASMVSAGLGAARGAGTDQGAGKGAKEAALSPWNLLGALGGAASWVGARAKPAAQEVAARHLQPNVEDVHASFGGPGVTHEESMRRAGQRAIDLGALEPSGPHGPLEMGDRARIIERTLGPDVAALENTVQELNVQGATLDRTALLLDIKKAILDRFDQPGAAEFTKKMRAVAEEVLQAIANDPDLSTGSPFSNFVTGKRFLQRIFEEHQSPIPGSEFNKMLERAHQDAARIMREHTEAAALRADPNVHGPEFVRLNRAVHENLPLKKGAEAESIRRLSGRAEAEHPSGYGPESTLKRNVIAQILKDTEPTRVKIGHDWLDPIYQGTPDNLHHHAAQLLRSNVKKRKKEE